MLDNSDPDYQLQIDFSRLSTQEGNTDSAVIKDILSIKHKAAEKLLLHPVIETYIDLKWKRAKKYFFANFITYLVFLLAFSFFLANIFYRPVHEQTTLVIDNVVFPTSDDEVITFSLIPKSRRAISFNYDKNRSRLSSNKGVSKNNDNVIFNRNTNLGDDSGQPNISNRIDKAENASENEDSG